MKNMLYNRKIFAHVTKIVVICFMLGMLYTGCLETTQEILIEMRLSATTLDFPSTEEQKSFAITSNTNRWNVSRGANSWLMVSPSSGSSNGTVNVTADENLSTSQRTATITVEGTGVKRTIDVTQAGARPNLYVSQSSLSFAAGGEQKTFTVTSNTDWAVSRGSTTWLTVTPASGSHNGTVNITAAANTSTSQRTANITVTGAGVTLTITVTQAGAAPNLTASATSLSYAAGGEQKTFTITSNTDWTVSRGSTTWLTVTPASGSNNGTINVTAAANTATTQRTGTITVTGGGITRTIAVTQAAASYTLTVSPASLNFTSSSEQRSFTITSNTSWTVTRSATWFTISSSSGSNNSTINVTATTNTSTTQRTATITVTGGGITRTINITQAGAGYNLSVSVSALSFISSYEQKTFTITSNTNWTVSSNASWLTVSPSSGSNNNTIYVTAAANTATTQRTATITVAGGGITRTISVAQAGRSASTSTLTFWTNCSNCTVISVVLNGVGTKTITSYYTATPASCGASGTATFENLSPGTYTFTASNSQGRTWSNTINVSAGCVFHQLLSN